MHCYAVFSVVMFLFPQFKSDCTIFFMVFEMNCITAYTSFSLLELSGSEGVLIMYLCVICWPLMWAPSVVIHHKGLLWPVKAKHVLPPLDQWLNIYVFEKC